MRLLLICAWCGFSTSWAAGQIKRVLAPPQSTTAIATAQPPAPTTSLTAPIIKDGSMSPLKISCQVGTPFSYSILPKTVKGVSSKIAGYTAESLPPGLGVNTATGVVSGTPTEAGVFNMPISATNAVGTGAAVVAVTVYSEHPTTATTIMRFKGTTESPFGYVEYLPKNYYLDSTRTFPVVVDLCGAGNISHKKNDPWSSNDQNKMWDLTYQAGHLNRANNPIFDDNDCIILSPIPPQWWEDVPLDKFFSFAYGHYRIDHSRIYLVGLSAGGDGVLDYMAAHGSDVAACVVSAFSHDNDPSKHNWQAFAHTPIWIFENWKDPFDNSKGDANKRHTIQFCNKVAQMLSGSAKPDDMLAHYPEPNLSTVQPTQDSTGIYTVADGWQWSPGVNSADGPPLRLTQCKNKGHGGWGQAYMDQSMWKWLFAQYKSAASTHPD